MKVIVVANQKGGIGKTTTATALASILAKEGYKTLLVDADQQGNSTDTYRASIDNTATLYDVILEDDENRVDIHEAIQHTPAGDIVASDPLIANADEILHRSLDGMFYFKDAMESIPEYDYVVVDTHPSVNAILQSILYATDYVIIPLTADRYAMQGLDQLIKTILVVKKRQNPGLKVAGFLLTDFDERLNISKEADGALSGIVSQLGTRLFRTKIRSAVKVREAQGARTPLLLYAPYCTAARDYREFANELVGEVLADG